MSRIFLETTIQVRRLLYEPKIRQSINAVIQEHEILTSTYVWMEVQRTIGQDYQHLIDLLHDQTPYTLSDLFYRLGENSNHLSSRRFGRIMTILGQLVTEFPDPDFDPFELAEYLFRRRRWLIHDAFFHGVDHVLDTTQCDLVKPDYTVPQGGRMSCRRETAQCALPDLLAQYHAQCQQLQTDSTNLAALDTTTQQALSRIVDDVTLAKGERTCWPLGDLILVLECPPDVLLWTTNMRHFEPLCRVFGRELYDSTGQS